MKSPSKTLRLFIAIAVGAPIFAGCAWEQKLNEGMGVALAAFYHYPMVASGGYDLLFCSGAFMRRKERWPKDYPELLEFVEQSEGYLELSKYERVEFGQLGNNGIQITFVPGGSTNELQFRVGARNQWTLSKTVQRRASRFAQRQSERDRRLAPAGDLCVRRIYMSTGYRLKIGDIGSLLAVASLWHRKQFASLVRARINKRKDRFRYFDDSGAEISLSEVHRRSQSDAKVRRSAYNLWFFYTRW
jgi:hypothetical protein